MLRNALLATAAVIGLMGAAQATTIVNLSAVPPNPNAGHNSGNYAYNPIVDTFGPGTYAVGVIGTAQGGAYNAYTIYASNGQNGAYSDGEWSVSPAGGSIVGIANSAPHFNTAAEALSYFSGLAPVEFTLTVPTAVSFYLDDSAYPYFADDSGGVSLAVNKVPEPGSLALLGTGLLGLGLIARRRNKTV